ncbi:MAG TPA: dienelactone hydrolase family protein [Terriglobales bacterium]|nr:dienelactone hydrolase family protein [Terriglobales bacterium]
MTNTMRLRATLAAVFFPLCAHFLWAADGKPVSYKSGDETVSGMLYAPAGKGPFPALVVIHEWWGLNDWVKQQASELAEQGYVTLALDLYRGKVATTPEEAHEIMRGVPQDRATRDLLAASAYLRSLKNVDKTRVGAIGWCMGGGYALDLALNDAQLKAVVINYGHLATQPETLSKIHAHVLGIFGGKDRGIPVDDVHKFEEQLKAQGKSVEIVIFPEAGHAFENPNNATGYRADDAAAARKKTLAFLEGNLKK